uniref:HMG box domain-containing protein n=1 Tax=Onchocerca volvulus TaxID=6282 RepID=A0A2K6VNE6_ONCVO
MAKKRSANGFMYFADARRAVYEAENKGVHLTAKKLVERATRDWKIMNENERQKWRSESRQRHDEYERQVYQMQSISIMNKSKTRPLSKLELSLQPKPFSYKLTESKRKLLRQSTYQKLIWREKENTTEMLAEKKFGMLTVRPYCIFESNNNGDELICPPAEICTYVMNLSEGVIDSERILIRHDYPINHQFYQFSRISENGFSELSQTPNHLNVHHAYFRIASEMKGCWSNLILVPASQYQSLAASLAWIKRKRDNALKRDTASIRTERLICMEDMIAVIGRIFETDVDDSSRWEQNISINFRYACDLHAAAPTKCPMVIGKSACQHFLDILRNLTSRNYRTREGCMLGNEDANHLNSIARPMRFKRVNPFQVVPFRDQKNKYASTDEPFSLIRLRTPEKMQYVTKWLNLLDVNTPMLENDNIEQAFTENFQKELFSDTNPL